ncbi:MULTISPECIES: glycosyltransferase family 4 protein [Halomonadaceae]|uniref:Glycosyltransferase n=1 Tax=Vreelandella halophila TaxID=86177 RepID=A0A9X4YBT2_9GAMM|nr:MULTISPECIES: glycosyltransferase family 4 protein [Halomonas]MYL26829.1 glycosyltransferase [Halomonas utahensis]MYL74090.1 glycosyltransferase [Halomonas sp. 22501_18_FS]
MECVIVYKEEYPWDVRVEKIALSLAKHGYSVTILARNLQQRPTLDSQESVRIQRLPRFKGLPRALRQLLNLPLWFNPVWLWHLLTVLPKSSPSALIIRDLPLAKIIIPLKKLRKIHTVLDMAECYPLMYNSIQTFSSSNGMGQNPFKNPRVAQRYERKAIHHFDHIWTMIEESRERTIRMGIPDHRVTIVSNTPPLDKVPGDRPPHSGKQVRIVYVGFLSRLRGLDTLLQGVNIFLKDNLREHIKVDIIGKGREKESLSRLIKELKISDVVTIHGWLEQKDVDNLLANANVGALTYRDCDHWNHTIPNKIFDYMASSLPVLATQIRPISRIIQIADCGVVCEDQNPQDVADKLSLLTDPMERQRMGSNGRTAVIERYNWENDESQLLFDISRISTQ